MAPSLRQQKSRPEGGGASTCRARALSNADADRFDDHESVHDRYSTACATTTSTCARTPTCARTSTCARVRQTPDVSATSGTFLWTNLCATRGSQENPWGCRKSSVENIGDFERTLDLARRLVFTRRQTGRPSSTDPGTSPRSIRPDGTDGCEVRLRAGRRELIRAKRDATDIDEPTGRATVPTGSSSRCRRRVGAPIHRSDRGRSSIATSGSPRRSDVDRRGIVRRTPTGARRTMHSGCNAR